MINVILFKYRLNFFAPLYSSLTLSGTYYYYFSVTVDNCLARLWFIDKNEQNSTHVITDIAKIYISLCFTQKCLLKWCLYSNYPHMFFPKHPTFKRRPIDYFAYLWISLNPLLKCFKMKPQCDQLNPCSKYRGSNPIKFTKFKNDSV